ncbi:glycosyl-transferase for dystroglycan-domain-containing protein [Endogone sp. FLAS-F59071]|nr:glycosyl-transferase for dystroglycan-domain-containing protein [Endogone sp. FLAS-F59071]|eukprot:RUS19013.1 glycosyl-transferase for dystroglycan-domain-containing protein [Endogone sp. FLAS-F59071]
MDDLLNRTQVRLRRIWRQWRRRQYLPSTATPLTKRALASRPPSTLRRLIPFVLILLVLSFLFRSPARNTTLIDPHLSTSHDSVYHSPPSSPRVMICNPTNRCSSWAPGKYDWQALMEQGVFHDVSRISVPMGMSVTFDEEETEEKEEKDKEDGEEERMEEEEQKKGVKSIVFNAGEFLCDPKRHRLCKVVKGIEIKKRAGVFVWSSASNSGLDSTSLYPYPLSTPASIFIALDQIKRNMTREKTRAQTTEAEIIYTHPADVTFSPEEVTLVSQFSVNRLERFEDAIATWDGPIAAVIYITDPNDITPLRAYFSHSSKSALYSRVTLTVFKPSYTLPTPLVHLRYPINRLRNLAVLTSPTSYIFVIDADFLPSPTLHAFAKAQAVSLLTRSPKLAVVIPCVAFRSPAPDPLPSTPAELRPLFRTGTAFLTDPRAGHGPTLTAQLFLARPLFVQDPHTYEVCYESQWEPYYILKRDTAPPYDERFCDQGGDKQSHALVLNAMGYKFRVARGVFIAHREHEKMQWPGGGLEKAQKEEREWTYFGAFMTEVETKYGKGARWPRGCAAKGVGWAVQRRDVIGIGAGVF